MCATRQEVDKLHKYLKQEQGIAEGALVCNGDMYAKTVFLKPFLTRSKNDQFYRDRLGTAIGKTLKNRPPFSQERHHVRDGHGQEVVPGGCREIDRRCEKWHLFLSFPYVCPEPVLAKRSSLNLNGAKMPFFAGASEKMAQVGMETFAYMSRDCFFNVLLNGSRLFYVCC
jgi:hypothetical protein